MELDGTEDAVPFAVGAFETSAVVAVTGADWVRGADAVGSEGVDDCGGTLEPDDAEGTDAVGADVAGVDDAVAVAACVWATTLDEDDADAAAAAVAPVPGAVDATAVVVDAAVVDAVEFSTLKLPDRSSSRILLDNDLVSMYSCLHLDAL